MAPIYMPMCIIAHCQMAKYNIKGVYTPCFKFGVDARCYLNAIQKYEAYEAVRELHKIWYDFFKNCPINATFLMICHSRGAVYVRNALMIFPAELRQRIEVIAIAPGGYIDPKLCKSVKHYESSADFVPLFDMAGRQRCRDTIITLEPHPKANPWFDHDFMSPTYQRFLRIDIEEYKMRCIFND
jgi:hypothetical protein